MWIDIDIKNNNRILINSHAIASIRHFPLENTLEIRHSTSGYSLLKVENTTDLFLIHKSLKELLSGEMDDIKLEGIGEISSFY